ncbi:MAG: hypothetical protein LBC96_10045 [Lachnospiraceae bacterium]|nr:hypothetical protein [Lachnospiraceae bacterium]
MKRFEATYEYSVNSALPKEIPPSDRYGGLTIFDRFGRVFPLFPLPKHPLYPNRGKSMNQHSGVSRPYRLY